MTSRREFLTTAAALPLLATPSLPFQRGVNFTAESPDNYSSDRAKSILESLPKYGVNSIAFVPYSFTPHNAPQVRFSPTGMMEKDADIEVLSALAHKKGMRVFLKPQVWVREGGPTDLDYPIETDRKKWFADYQKYIEHHAQFAQKISADLFSIGVEFSRLAKHEAEWRALIAKVRTIYRGKLTYSANFGPEFETIKFWDALDFIGLNNYYPLPDDLSTAKIEAKVEAVHRKFNKPVIFPEAGYASLEAPHRKPWDESPRKLSMQDQVRCYEALFNGFYKKPWFQGVYWWKVGTNGFGGADDGSHTPWNKPAMQVISKWYLRGGR